MTFHASNPINAVLNKPVRAVLGTRKLTRTERSALNRIEGIYVRTD
jgi:hypothetical protein